MVDLSVLKGFTILIDCDVIQADGGTRTASITGSFTALYIALAKMVKDGKITHNPIREFVAAISAGICNNIPLLDLEYEEDSTAQVDANFVLTENGKLSKFRARPRVRRLQKKTTRHCWNLPKKASTIL